MTQAAGRYTRIGAAAIVLLLAVGASACAQKRDPTVAPTRITPTPTSDVTIERDIPYRDVDGETLALDLCLPAEPTGADPAVLLLHGGGFTQGGRDDEGIQNLCVWFAERGFIGVPVSYRLGDGQVFPAQLEDAQAAVTWLRDPENAATYGIDPAKIGALGSSAGGILAMSLATFGEGSLTEGSRIGAAVSLSGVSIMTEQALTVGEPTPEAANLLLGYLGCRSTADCPPAAEASPLTHAGAGDSPMLMFASQNEFVPYQQSELLQQSLSAAGVPARVVVDPGTAHGYPLLTADNRTIILEFLDQFL